MVSGHRIVLSLGLFLFVANAFAEEDAIPTAPVASDAKPASPTTTPPRLPVNEMTSTVPEADHAPSTPDKEKVKEEPVVSKKDDGSHIPDYGAWVQVPKPGEFYLVAVKDKNKLMVKSLTEPNKIFKTYHAISGTNAGDKEREGDKKTPEGIYFVERRVPKARMTALHGAAAFELNYPNPVDRIKKRSGHGIWIHGVDNEARLTKLFDTLGCVAVSNKDISDLGTKLTLKNTPIVIVSSEKEGEPIGIETGDSPLYRRVLDWAAAWSSRDIGPYLAFYDKDFYSRGMNYEGWKKYKTRLAKNYKEISVTLRDMKILKHGKYSVVIFRQDYQSDKFSSSSMKRLYLVGIGDEAKILAEEVAEESVGKDPEKQVSVGSF